MADDPALAAHEPGAETLPALEEAPALPSAADVSAELASHPQLEALVELVRSAALEAAAARRPEFASRFHRGASAAPKLPEGLTRADADTAYGNVVAVLERGVEQPEEGLLLGALLALSLRPEPDSEDEERALVLHLVWLATHTPCDALGALDEAAGERESVFSSLAAVALEPGAAAADFGRSEALVAAAALGASGAPGAFFPRAEALRTATDPQVRALLQAGALDAAPLAGEIVPAPLGAALTVVLAFTLLLFVRQALFLIARFVFAYRRPAQLRLTPRGLELSHRVLLLGKVLRDRSTLVPLANLSRVTREVRYARLGLYAGLTALVLGTYFGMGLFVDGLRVPGGSSALIQMAIATIVAGLALDFVLTSMSDGVRGRCRMVIEPRSGRRLCVGSVDPGGADAMLAGVAALVRAPGA